MSLIGIGRPSIGAVFEPRADSASGTATAATFLLGIPTDLLTPSLDLGSVFPALTGCRSLTDLFNAPVVTNAVPGANTTAFAVPNVPALIGFSGLSLSALVLDPGTEPLVQPSDEIVLTLGL